MKKLILSATLLGMAGVASAFAGSNIAGGGDVVSTSIIRNALGSTADPGAVAAREAVGVKAAQGGVVVLYKNGGNLIMELNQSGFAAAQESLAGLGTVDAKGNIVITGDGLNTLASNVGVNPGDLTVKKLTIKKAGI